MPLLRVFVPINNVLDTNERFYNTIWLDSPTFAHPLKGNVVLKCSHIWFLEFRDFLAVVFTFLGELQLWFVNLQSRIKVMLILAFLSVQANSVS